MIRATIIVIGVFACSVAQASDWWPASSVPAEDGGFDRGWRAGYAFAKQDRRALTDVATATVEQPRTVAQPVVDRRVTQPRYIEWNGAYYTPEAYELMRHELISAAIQRASYVQQPVYSAYAAPTTYYSYGGYSGSYSSCGPGGCR